MYMNVLLDITNIAVTAMFISLLTCNCHIIRTHLHRFKRLYFISIIFFAGVYSMLELIHESMNWTKILNVACG